MKTMCLLLLSILASCSSCEKLGLCKDKELTLSRLSFTGTQLRIHGFYYGNPDTAWDKTIRYQILVFYSNGIVLLPGVSEFSQLEEDFEKTNRSMDVVKKSKFNWGVFHIENNTIKIEHWLPAQCGYPVILRTGEVLNDTTFRLTKMIRRDSQGTTQKDINQMFYFREFSPKPDSTNNFIK